MNTENFVKIREYRDHIIGELMMSALKDAGIQAFKIDEMNTTLPIENEFMIMVHESDVEAALEIIEEREGEE
jgi:predicted Fe-Mo cluster-binding NifX family protein